MCVSVCDWSLPSTMVQIYRQMLQASISHPQAFTSQMPHSSCRRRRISCTEATSRPTYDEPLVASPGMTVI